MGTNNVAVASSAPASSTTQTAETQTPENDYQLTDQAETTNNTPADDTSGAGTETTNNTPVDDTSGTETDATNAASTATETETGTKANEDASTVLTLADIAMLNFGEFDTNGNGILDAEEIDYWGFDHSLDGTTLEELELARRQIAIEDNNATTYHEAPSRSALAAADQDGDGILSDWEVADAGLDTGTYVNQNGKGTADDTPMTMAEADAARANANSSTGKTAEHATPTQAELIAADQDGNGILSDQEIADASLDSEVYVNQNGKGAEDNTPMNLEQAEAARINANYEKSATHIVPQSRDDFVQADSDTSGLLESDEIADALYDPHIYMHQNGKGAADDTPMTIDEAEAARIAQLPVTETTPREFDPRLDLPGGQLLDDDDMRVYQLLKDADDILTYLMDKIRETAKANQNKLSDAKLAQQNLGQYDTNGDGSLSDEEIARGGLDTSIYDSGSTETGSGKNSSSTENPDYTLEEAEYARREAAVAANAERGSYITPTAESLVAADQNGDEILSAWEIADAHFDPNKYGGEITLENAELIRQGKPTVEVDTTAEDEFVPDPTKGEWYNAQKSQIDDVDDYSSSSMALWVSNFVNRITTFISTIVSLSKTSGDISKTVDRKMTK
ncbi:MAG: hypothetical protein WC527_04665 [Candidatus Margulisiibacteriota bacterium]